MRAVERIRGVVAYLTAPVVTHEDRPESDDHEHDRQLEDREWPWLKELTRQQRKDEERAGMQE